MATALVFLEHHFGRFDNNCHGIALFQSKLLDTLSSDNTFDRIFSDIHDHVSHDFAYMNFGDLADKLVSS